MVHRPPATHPVAGLAFRTYAGPDDIPDLVRIQRAASLQDDTENIPTEERIANEFAHADGFDPASDVFLAELDGQPVAIGETRYIKRDGVHTYSMGGAVHPDVRRRGIGRALLGRLEARAAERAKTLPDDGLVWLDSWMSDSNAAFNVLMDQFGYAPIRHFFEMLKTDLETALERDLPPGVELRPVVLADLRQIYDAEEEAFRDHWGQREWGDTRFAELVADPDLDLSLWRVAWDGDQVAGVVSTYIFAEENAVLGQDYGWLATVSTRRPWRRRGVAAALILSACVALRERGMTGAALGVDASSAVGALDLYEGLGFVVHKRWTTWRRTLRPGPTA